MPEIVPVSVAPSRLLRFTDDRLKLPPEVYVWSVEPAAEPLPDVTVPPTAPTDVPE